MSGLFLLEIKVEPTANPITVYKKLASVFQGGLQGQIRYVFQIVGENSVCAILKWPLDGIWTSLNEQAGGSIDLQCIPLRRYEHFAQQVLKVGDTALTTPLEPPMVLDSDAFLLDFKVDYVGKSFDELMETWKREATAALTVRTKGMELDLFKVVAQNRVLLLIKGDADTVDNALFTLPIVRENGDQTHITAKAVVAFPKI